MVTRLSMEEAAVDRMFCTAVADPVHDCGTAPANGPRSSARVTAAAASEAATHPVGISHRLWSSKR
jgi:hypothetical protein